MYFHRQYICAIFRTLPVNHRDTLGSCLKFDYSLQDLVEIITGEATNGKVTDHKIGLTLFLSLDYQNDSGRAVDCQFLSSGHIFRLFGENTFLISLFVILHIVALHLKFLSMISGGPPMVTELSNLERFSFQPISEKPLLPPLCNFCSGVSYIQDFCFPLGKILYLYEIWYNL